MLELFLSSRKLPEAAARTFLISVLRTSLSVCRIADILKVLIGWINWWMKVFYWDTEPKIPSLGKHGDSLTCSLDRFITEVPRLELELVQIKPERNKAPEEGETCGSRAWDVEQAWNCSVETGNVLSVKLFFIFPYVVTLWKEKKLALIWKLNSFIIIDHIGRVISQEVPR